MKPKVQRWFALFLIGLLTSIPAYSQSQTAEHPASLVDQAELRVLTRQYFDALVKNDWKGISHLVSINSMDMLERKQLIQPLLDHSAQVRLVKLTIGKISVQETDIDAIKDLIVKETTANMTVEVNISAIDSRTGKPITYLAQMNRILTWKKGGESFGDGGIREIGWPLHHARSSQNPLQTDQQRLESAESLKGWKLLSDLPDAESLVEPLRSAGSDEEVRDLISEETQIGLGFCIKNLERRGGDLIRNDQLSRGLECFRLARKLEKELLARKRKRGQDKYTDSLQAAHDSLAKLQQRDKDTPPPLNGGRRPVDIPGAPGFASLNSSADEASITEGIGDVHVDHATYSEALKYYLKSLSLFDKSNNNSSRWRVAQKIGYVYAKEQNYSKAIEFYLESIKYYQEMKAGEPLVGRVDDHKARMLDKIGDAYVLQGAFDKALESYQQSIKELERLTLSLRTQDPRYNDVTSQLVNAIESVAKVYQWQHKDVQLLQFYRESEHELESIGLNDEALALLAETALYWMEHNNFDAALDAYQRLHAHYDQLANKSDDDYLTITFLDFGMAAIHLIKGDNTTAVQLLTRAEAAISKTSSDGDLKVLKPFVEGWMRQMIGAVIFDQGDESAGEQIIKEGHAKWPDVFWQGGQSVSKTLAMFARLNQDNLDALELYRNALALTDIEGDPEQAVDLLCEIGEIYARQGKSNDALGAYQEALRLVSGERNDSGGGVGPQDFYWKRVNQVPTDAPTMDALKRDMDVKERDRQKLRIPRALILLRIGSLYKEGKQYAPALEALQGSLNLSQSLTPRDSTLLSNNLAEVCLLQGHYDQASVFIKRALANGQIADPLLRSETDTLAGRIYRSEKDPAKAREAFAQAIKLIESTRMAGFGDEEERLLFTSSHFAPYYEMISLLLGEQQINEALASSELTKSRLMLEIMRNGKLDLSSVMTAEERKTSLSFKNRLAFLSGEIRQEQNERVRQKLSNALESIRLEYRVFQLRVYAAHPEVKNQRSEPEPARSEQFANLLPNSSSALLNYVVSENEVYLFVITKGRADAAVAINAYVIPIGKKELEAKVNQFRTFLESRSNNFRLAASDLFDLLLKKAQAELSGKTTLIIIPDGVLWNLPFQALQGPSQHYLIEESAISYAPSLAALREMMNKHDRMTDSARFSGSVSPGSGKRSFAPVLLAVGNPTLEKSTAKISSSPSSPTLCARRNELSAIPEAEREVNEIVRLYGAESTGSKSYVRSNATETALKREAGKYKILHLATHGVLDDRSPLDSYVVLAKSTNLGPYGTLSAREMMTLSLHADLVVLSACETAEGRVRDGEGLIGMTWALVAAGTPTVVASQWEVNSCSTTDLMIEFHRHLKDRVLSGEASIGTADALRQAALILMKKDEYQHPFYWAGFVVVGDGR